MLARPFSIQLLFWNSNLTYLYLSAAKQSRTSLDLVNAGL
nr:MAG TPA: hypothetical protein [Bacteriophage sp.]